MSTFTAAVNYPNAYHGVSSRMRHLIVDQGGEYAGKTSFASHKICYHACLAQTTEQSMLKSQNE